MKRFIPSPAMAVAMVALFLVGGGSAIAAKHYVVKSSSQVKNGVLTLADFKKSEQTKLKGAAGATGATGAAGTPATRLWAVVDVTGGTPTYARSAGTVGAPEDITPGEVGVTFNQDISQCSWQVSAGDANAGSSGDRFATVERRSGANVTSLAIRTWDREGTGTTMQDDQDFHVAVFC